MPPLLDQIQQRLGHSPRRVRPIRNLRATFSESDKRVQISPSGGAAPVWSQNGEIFYRNDHTLVAVTVSALGDELEISNPAMLFEMESDTAAFDVTADGQSFLMLRPRARENISLIFNWPEEMARITEVVAGGSE